MRRMLLATLSLPFLAIPTAALAGGGCIASGPAQPQRTTRIDTSHACFAPLVVSVPVGSEVTWANTGDMAHDVTGPAIRWAELPPGAEHKVRFDKAGIWLFSCTIHAGMNGAVIVGDLPAAAVGTAPAAVDTAPTLDAEPVAASRSGVPGGTTAWAVAALVTLGAAALVVARGRGVRRASLG